MEQEKKKIKISDPKQGLIKARSYCAYQERCHQEVKDKLYEWGLWKEAVDQILSDLIMENFLNEERFAKMFAGGKFRIKKWGRVKIRLELKKRNVSEYCIQKGLQEIEDKDYSKTLKEIIQDKLKGKSTITMKYKAAQYALSRGYEPELVWEIINNKL